MATQVIHTVDEETANRHIAARTMFWEPTLQGPKGYIVTQKAEGEIRGTWWLMDASGHRLYLGGLFFESELRACEVSLTMVDSEIISQENKARDIKESLERLRNTSVQVNNRRIALNQASKQ